MMRIVFITLPPLWIYNRIEENPGRVLFAKYYLTKYDNSVNTKQLKQHSCTQGLRWSQVSTPIAHSHKYPSTNYVACGHGDQVLP